MTLVEIWQEYIVAMIETMSPGTEITTDYLWSIANDRPPTSDPRIMGQVIQLAKKRGLIAVVPGEQRKSVRPECHRRPMTVWRRTRKT